MPPQRAHWWQMHFLQVQQKTLSFSWWFSHLQSPTTVNKHDVCALGTFSSLKHATFVDIAAVKTLVKRTEWSRSRSRSSLVFVVVLVLGEAAELQGVQLLGDFFCPPTVNQLPQLQRSPEHEQHQLLNTPEKAPDAPSLMNNCPPPRSPLPPSLCEDSHRRSLACTHRQWGHWALCSVSQRCGRHQAPLLLTEYLKSAQVLSPPPDREGLTLMQLKQQSFEQWGQRRASLSFSMQMKQRNTSAMLCREQNRQHKHSPWFSHSQKQAKSSRILLFLHESLRQKQDFPLSSANPSVRFMVKLKGVLMKFHTLPTIPQPLHPFYWHQVQDQAEFTLAWKSSHTCHRCSHQENTFLLLYDNNPFLFCFLHRNVRHKHFTKDHLDFNNNATGYDISLLHNPHLAKAFATGTTDPRSSTKTTKCSLWPVTNCTAASVWHIPPHFVHPFQPVWVLYPEHDQQQ